MNFLVPVPLAAAARPPALAIRFAGPGEEAEGTDAVPGQGQEEDPLPLPAPTAIQVPPEAPLQFLLPSAAEGEARRGEEGEQRHQRQRAADHGGGFARQDGRGNRDDEDDGLCLF